VREQPGYVHLGDSELLADLGLRHVAVEPHGDNGLLPLGQFADVRPDCFHVHRRAERLVVVVPEQIAERSGVRVGGERRVQRQGLKCAVRIVALANVADLTAEMLGNLLFRRGSVQLLGQVGLAGKDLGPQFLRRPADVDLPALIPEVTLDLAADARTGVSGEAGAVLGSKPT
jgi:hypothetical protein